MMRKNWPAFVLGGMLAALAVFFALGLWANPHPADLPSGDSLQPPGAGHLLGTDNLGVDIYAQLSGGFFSSMALGLVCAAGAFVLGTAAGMAAALAPGGAAAAVDLGIHLFLAMPQLPVLVVLGAFFGQSRAALALIITLFSWAPIAKQVRAAAAAVRGRMYVRLAARYGGGLWYLLRAHILPEVLGLAAVNGLGVCGRAILQESSLAYLGLGDPLARSWGLMISKASRFSGIYFTDYWLWWLLPPVLALLCTLLCVRLLARWLERRLPGRATGGKQDGAA